ncbi:MAG: hypothetical protein ABH883_00370 [Candidatus Omnitrophota bacterium]
MVRKFILSVTVFLFAVSCGSMSYAQGGSDNYVSQLGKLNQAMKDARDTYKQKMRNEDTAISEQMRKLDKNDTDGRKKLLDQKRTQKKQLEMEYKKQQETIRSEVKQLKAARNETRKSGSKAEKGKPVKAEKK